MIGIIAAMNVEMESLRSFMSEPRTETISGITFVSGTLEGKRGRDGGVRHRQGVRGDVRPDDDPALQAGVHRQHRRGRHAVGQAEHRLDCGFLRRRSARHGHQRLGDPVGLISGINKVQLPADPDLCGQLSACATVLGIRTETGVIASGDQFISSSERKDAIVKTFGAIACEMEGAAIGQVCYVNRVPFCVLRAISDSADGSSHMDYPTFVGMAAEQSVKLLRTFLKN